jgi:hypothetical protein
MGFHVSKPLNCQTCYFYACNVRIVALSHYKIITHFFALNHVIGANSNVTLVKITILI